MALFTIVLDYRGGTYLNQIRATTPAKACQKWARDLDASAVYGLGKTGKAELIEELRFDRPRPFDELTNAWCLTAIARGQLALINVVKTDSLN